MLSASHWGDSVCPHQPKAHDPAPTVTSREDKWPSSGEQSGLEIKRPYDSGCTVLMQSWRGETHRGKKAGIILGETLSWNTVVRGVPAPGSPEVCMSPGFSQASGGFYETPRQVFWSLLWWLFIRHLLKACFSIIGIWSNSYLSSPQLSVAMPSRPASPGWAWTWDMQWLHLD